MRRRTHALVLSTAVAVLATGAPAAAQSGGADDGLVVTLVDPAGSEVGTLTAGEVADGVEVSVEASGLPPGFHGLHLHSVGVCEPDSASPSDPGTTGDFLSAGGHIGAGETSHGEHPGDLPSLFVTGAGTASLTTVTDAVTLADLRDDDGSAVMVHSGRDNFANVPERYAPDGPDQTTLDTGDAGTRIACGVVDGAGMTMPEGGVDAGDGAVDDPTSTALLALGGGALLGAAGLALVAVRNGRRQPQR